jgi:acetolactate synthase regulatory subunit
MTWWLRRKEGLVVNRKRVLRVMRERGLLVWEEQINGSAVLGAARAQRFIRGARQRWD